MPITISKKATVPVSKKFPVKAVGVNAQAGPAIQSAALDRENAFNVLYNNDGQAGAFAPPYDPDDMATYVETNNMLNSCIDAMVSNIDGTGFELTPGVDKNGDALQDEDVPAELKEKLKGFFSEPWPGTSFKTMRKRLRRDMETGGNAYIEVMRNAAGEIALMRRLDPGITRVMRYDDKVFEENVWSAVIGQDIKVMMKRRRFVQYYFGKFIYFKEFGAPEVLGQRSGHWITEADATQQSVGDIAPVGDPSGATAVNLSSAPMPGESPATEVIHLMAQPHHILPYGIPRWIMQTPSVIGSRKAEEFNLGFFDAGGVPPMMIIVQGGEVGDKVEQALKDLYYSKGQHKQIATILNINATGGSLDNESQTKVTVERFGAERQKDGMFALYDQAAGNKVRRAFRLPPLFVGDTQDFNYATALASYRVGEAQVFKPERDHFDEIVNTMILPAMLGRDLAKTVQFRSLPITARDMDQQIKGVELAVAAQLVDREEAVETINEITGLKMTPSEQPVVISPTAGGKAGLPSNAAPNAAAPVNPDQLALQQKDQDHKHQMAEQQQSANDEGDAYSQIARNSTSFKRDTKKKDVSIEDIMSDEAILILRSGETGTRRAFDAVEWMRSIDAEKRDLFGRRVGKALFACDECEEPSAAKLALKMLEAAVEEE